MQTAKVSDYRSCLSKYHQRIMEDHDPLRIASRSGDVVILPADDYENMIETMYILKDEATMSSLLKTRADIAQGSFQGVEVKDGFKDILEP
jgi:antitoxin YefM